MNPKQYIWDFFVDLQNNNSKEWMDEHRSRYLSAKQYWLDEVEAVLDRLAQYEDHFSLFDPKDTIQRINNNRMFHPDRPIYKGHFSSSPSGKTDQISKIFFAFGPSFTMIGGGIYRPEKAALKSIRDAIDYDANELLDIINGKKFVKLFGGLSYDETQLKSSPRGYSKDHPHVNLLRRKSFTAGVEPRAEDIINGSLTEMVEDAYLTLRPFNDWLERAISV